jgi:hypothetical protein
MIIFHHDRTRAGICAFHGKKEICNAKRLILLIKTGVGGFLVKYVLLTQEASLKAGKADFTGGNGGNGELEGSGTGVEG